MRTGQLSVGGLTNIDFHSEPKQNYGVSLVKKINNRAISLPMLPYRRTWEKSYLPLLTNHSQSLVAPFANYWPPQMSLDLHLSLVRRQSGCQWKDNKFTARSELHYQGVSTITWLIDQNIAPWCCNCYVGFCNKFNLLQWRAYKAPSWHHGLCHS